MISSQAQTFFDQLKLTKQLDGGPFNLEKERHNANAAGELAVDPQGICKDEISVAGVRCLRLAPHHCQSSHILIFVQGGDFGLMSPENHKALAGHIALACKAVIDLTDYIWHRSFPTLMR